jgi:SAM-dependent methyltransferase
MVLREAIVAWEDIDNEKDAAFYILGARDYSGTLRPDADMLRELVPAGASWRVLDMACGLGRNLLWLNRARPECEIWGYDLPNMVGLASAYLGRHAPGNSIMLTSDFSRVDRTSFDAVIATLAFQNISPERLDEYYLTLARCLGDNGVMLVNGRDWSDHNNREIVWDRLRLYFDVANGHPLSAGFSTAAFSREHGTMDHHRAVFMAKGRDKGEGKGNVVDWSWEQYDA